MNRSHSDDPSHLSRELYQNRPSDQRYHHTRDFPVPSPRRYHRHDSFQSLLRDGAEHRRSDSSSPSRSNSQHHRHRSFSESTFSEYQRQGDPHRGREQYHDRYESQFSSRQNRIDNPPELRSTQHRQERNSRATSSSEFEVERGTHRSSFGQPQQHSDRSKRQFYSGGSSRISSPTPDHLSTTSNNARSHTIKHNDANSSRGDRRNRHHIIWSARFVFLFRCLPFFLISIILFFVLFFTDKILFCCPSSDQDQQISYFNFCFCQVLFFRRKHLIFIKKNVWILCFYLHHLFPRSLLKLRRSSRVFN